MLNWRKPLLAALIVSCVVFVAACGSSNSSSSASSSAAPASSSSSTSTSAASSSSSGGNPAVAKLVPAAIKSKGTLTVAADASYAPDEYFAPDGHTVIGMDADLSKALAAAMGLKANVVNSTFDWNGFSPVTWSGTASTPNRLGSKVVSGWQFNGATDWAASTSDNGRPKRSV